LLACVPVPEKDALKKNEIDRITAAALQNAAELGVVGSAVTPHVLKYIAEATSEGSVRANLALAENNASIAAQLASVLTK